MGVDCKVTLAPGARLQDVAEVIGIAAGLPSRRWELKTGRNEGQFLAVAVDGVSVKGYERMPQLAEISLDGPCVDGETVHGIAYHFEWSGGEVPGCTGLMPRSTPFWCAVMRRVVDFFGGSIDFNDSDETELDYFAPVAHRAAADGRPWQEFQDAIASVEPVTPAEMDEARKWAAYS